MSTIRRIFYPLLALLAFIFAWAYFYIDLLVLLFRQPNVTNEEVRLAIYNIFFDDLFYYLEIARNILLHSYSSFDGITHTNGYHPLWMLILVGMGWLLPVDSLAYAWLLIFVSTACVTIGTIIFHQVARLYSRGKASFLPAVAYFYSGMYCSSTGLEVTLVILFFPIFLWLVIAIVQAGSVQSNSVQSSSKGKAFLLGLCTSFLLLSRLDTILIVTWLGAILLIYLYWTKSPAISFANALLFVAGLIPFGLYLVYNFVNYGHLIPLSGQAKAMTQEGFFISRVGFNSIIDRAWLYKTVLGFWLVTMLGIVVGLIRSIRGQRWMDWGMTITMLSPFVFFAYYLTHSDWPFWGWYFYSLCWAFSLAVLLFDDLMLSLRWKLQGQPARFLIATGSTALIMLLTLARANGALNRDFTQNVFIDSALHIRQFAAAHPGLYAMGDAAGAVAFLLDEPLLQLEGLVADDKMIENIRLSRKLEDVLDEYGVDYYITIREPLFEDGCWHTTEPAVPGPYVPRMQGTFCTAPVFNYEGLKKITIFPVNREGS